MAKLTVKNVGPIREAELEVKKHTVFIGPQGSGKSTLAKLIAICSDTDMLPWFFRRQQQLLQKYNLFGYVNLNDEESDIDFENQRYSVSYLSNQFDFAPTDETNKEISRLANEAGLKIQDYDIYRNSKVSNINIDPSEDVFFIDILIDYVMQYNSVYIPAERNLTSSLSNAIWSLLYSDINLPKAITLYGRQFEEARNSQHKLEIPFLGIYYERRNGQDFVEYQSGLFVELSQSASGYQSIIPLLLVIEYQRQQSHRRFIIEEPELNLYPTAQKDLIYSLMGGLQPNIEYKDAEWVITTHSPYVLSSFNTLMLAYKVAQKSDELRAEVEKIIPSRCWINPDDFAAYYVDKGTVRSIISEKTGLIADNELDDVSDDLADEQDKLFALSRSVPRV